MLYMFFAAGFEETEAVGALDMLRRGEIEVKSVGVGGKSITGSHDITVVCDLDDAGVSFEGLAGIVLPGGMPGTLNLEKSAVVRSAIEYCVQNDLLIAAICAAPSILGRAGLLEGKRYTCYPGFEQGLVGDYTGERVQRDGKLITGKGPGCTIPFAIEVIRVLRGDEIAAQVEGKLQ